MTKTDYETIKDLYTTVGEYSLNARLHAAMEGQEGLPLVLDICRRNDSGNENHKN